MGTWGFKNFENDTAGDFYLLFVERIAKDIQCAIDQPTQLFVGSYWSDIIPCMVEILAVLAEQEYHIGSLPEAEVIERWKTAYMYMWLRTIDLADPDEEYRIERENELNKTFDKLIYLAKQEK